MLIFHPVEFFLDRVLKRCNLSKILKTLMPYNSGVPRVDSYLKIIIIGKPNDYYARIFVGALYGRAKFWKQLVFLTIVNCLRKIMVQPYGGIYTDISCREGVGKTPSGVPTVRPQDWRHLWSAGIQV